MLALYDSFTFFYFHHLRYPKFYPPSPTIQLSPANINFPFPFNNNSAVAATRMATANTFKINVPNFFNNFFCIGVAGGSRGGEVHPD